MKTAYWKVATTSNRSIVDSSSKKVDWTADDTGQYTTMTIAENCPVEIPAENMLEGREIIHDDADRRQVNAGL